MKQVAGKTICGWRDSDCKYFQNKANSWPRCKKFRHNLKITNRYFPKDGIRLDKCKELSPNGIWQ